MATKRPDRSEKLLERKNLSETVVKCSLRNMLLGEYKESMYELIEQRVKHVSVRTHNASVALNLLVHDMFDGQIDVSNVDIPEFWDQTFIRQLMLGTKEAQQPNPIVKNLFERFPYLLSNDKRDFGDRNIYSAAAIKLSTNIRNHLVLNFPKVIKRYLYDTTTLSKDEVVLVQRNLYGWAIGKIRKTNIAIFDLQNVNRETQTIKHILQLGAKEIIGKLWFKKKENLKHMLKLFVQTNRSIDIINAINNDNMIPLINILPICKIKSHFITIDTYALVGIKAELGINVKNTAEHKTHWDGIFNIGKLKGADKKFTGTIDTDGLVVNVHYQQQKTTNANDSNTEELPSLDGKRVIGVDPGRVNIFTMVEELPNGRWKTYTLTRRQYYAESGINTAKKQSEKWNGHVKNELQVLSGASPKASTLPKFMEYIEAWLQTRDALWKEYTTKKWASQRFRLYGGKKRVFSKFINRLKPCENTVLAYGSAKFAPGGKGELSVPTTRAFKEMSYIFAIRLICEYRTSKVYWKDDSVLLRVAKKNANGRLVDVRGLLWCGSTKETNKFVNRDLNAAVNILRCAKLPKRPEMLNRALSIGGKLEPRIGKIIRC